MTIARTYRPLADERHWPGRRQIVPNPVNVVNFVGIAP